MATIYADPDGWAPDRLTAERRTQHILRAITSRGWEQRLGPLAVYMAE